MRFDFQEMMQGSRPIWFYLSQLLAAVKLWGLVLAAIPCAVAEGERPSLEASGALRGYFLTAEGQLTIRTVQLSTLPQSEPTTILHPLWSSYYFTGSVRSEGRGITQVRAFSGQRLLWQRKFPAPCKQTALPEKEGTFLGVPARDRLSLRLEVTEADGQRQSVELKPVDVRWGAMPPLRIDWLDLIRIAEVRKLVREKGGQIWKGFHADRVPFLIEGDHQWVLVDHPKPPKGFTRYRGKLPLPLSLHVGASAPAILRVRRHEGETVQVNGVYTAALRYRPFWYAFPEGRGNARSGEEATQRLAVIAHEAFHVWMLNSTRAEVKFSGRLLRPPSAEVIAFRVLETEALRQAVEADLKEAKELILKFLALRAGRRAGEESQKEAIAVEQRIELEEGLAYYAMAQALRAAATDYQLSSQMRTDPFFEGYQPIDPLEWLTGKSEETSGIAIEGERSLEGYAQVLLLERLGMQWEERVLQGQTSLDELLARAVGWTQKSRAEQQASVQQLKAEESFRETVVGIRQEFQNLSHIGSAQFEQVQKGQRVGLWVLASLSSRSLPHQPPPMAQGHWLPGFQMNSGRRLQVEVKRLCWVSDRLTLSQPTLELFVPLDPKKELLWLRREGNSTSLKTKEVMIYAENADLQVMPHNLRLRMPGGQRSLKESEPRGSRSKMRKAKWIVVPLLLLGTVTSAQAQIEGQTVTQTATGVFEDAGTGQRQYLTLDLLDPELNPPGDWVTVSTETYTLNADVYDTYGRLNGLTLTDENGNILDQKTADPPVGELHAQGLRIFGIPISIGGTIGASHTVTGPAKCTWTFTIGVTIQPAPRPTLVAKVINGKSNTPISGAWVYFFRSSRPNEVQSLQTDATGMAELVVSKASDWMMEVRLQVSWAFCNVKKGPYTLKSTKVTDSFVLYPHGVVEGKVSFQGGGYGDPAQVEIVEVQNGATAQVDPVPNPDGSYTYTFPFPFSAGSYTLRATYRPTGEVKQSTVTVPDNCTLAQTDPRRGISYALDPKGAHSEKISGPAFTFTVQGSGG